MLVAVIALASALAAALGLLVYVTTALVGAKNDERDALVREANAVAGEKAAALLVTQANASTETAADSAITARRQLAQLEKGTTDEIAAPPDPGHGVDRLRAVALAAEHATPAAALPGGGPAASPGGDAPR